MTDDPTDHNRTRSEAGRTKPDGTVAMTDEIERALGRLSPPGATVSLLAVRPVDDAVVAAAAPDRALSPASNTKLITAALSFDRLGPDHCFETTIAASGSMADRRLDGDLVLRGSGAPDVTPADLSDLADSVSNVVDQVGGNLVCDVASFTGPQLGPGRVWADEHHPYGARSSALAVSGNLVDVTVTSTVDGMVVSIEPETDVVDIHVDPLTASGSDSDGDPALDIGINRDDRGIQVHGTIPPDETETVRVPVLAPVRHCGLVARDALAAAGVEVTGDLRIVDDHHTETDAMLDTVESAPLRKLVRTMNVESDNFVADQLARGTAAAVTGEGSWDAWTELVSERFAALGIESVRVRDGSGLSRYNRLPARGMVALMEWATNQPWSDAFFASLPGPGEGTLTDRLQGVPVVAKTGTLTGTRALSGRVGTGADAIFFSVLVGDITVDAEAVRDGQDELVRALAAACSGND